MNIFQPSRNAGASGSSGQTGAIGAMGVTGEWRLNSVMIWVLCILFAGCVKGQVGNLREQP